MKLVIFTKDIMDSYIPITVGNIPTLRFLGGSTNKGTTGNGQGAWYKERSVSVVTSVGVTVEAV